MSVLNDPPAPQAIDGQVETLVAGKPALEPVLRPLGRMLAAKARMVEALRGKLSADSLHIDGSALARGAPLLEGVSTSPLEPRLSRTLASLPAPLGETFPALQEPWTRLETALSREVPGLDGVWRAFLDGDRRPLVEAARTLETPPEILGLAVRLALGIVLEALEPSLKNRGREEGWLKGYCPLCGSMPFAGSLSAEDSGSEYLVGGGGRRYLHCSLCAHSWHVRRGTCPACDNSDPRRFMYYRVEGKPAERVEVCNECNGYLVCLDLRETSSPPSMEVAALGMIHLDAWAREQGYHPLAETLWNMVE